MPSEAKYSQGICQLFKRSDSSNLFFRLKMRLKEVELSDFITECTVKLNTMLAKLKPQQKKEGTEAAPAQAIKPLKSKKPKADPKYTSRIYTLSPHRKEQGVYEVPF